MLREPFKVETLVPEGFELLQERGLTRAGWAREDVKL